MPAVIEIISPGNKDRRAALRDFVEKTIDLLREGIHVLIVAFILPSPTWGIKSAEMLQNIGGNVAKPLPAEGKGRQLFNPRGRDTIYAKIHKTNFQRTYFLHLILMNK